MPIFLSDGFSGRGTFRASRPNYSSQQRVKHRRNGNEQRLSPSGQEAALKKRDPRELTVRELGELAAKVRSSAIDSKEYKRAIEDMAIASLYLEDSGALGQLLWWAKDEVELEAPPDAKAEVIEFSPPGRPELVT
jgi:hypothetical protein